MQDRERVLQAMANEEAMTEMVTEVQQTLIGMYLTV